MSRAIASVLPLVLLIAACATGQIVASRPEQSVQTTDPESERSEYRHAVTGKYLRFCIPLLDAEMLREERVGPYPPTFAELVELWPSVLRTVEGWGKPRSKPDRATEQTVRAKAEEIAVVLCMRDAGSITRGLVRPFTETTSTIPTYGEFLLACVEEVAPAERHSFTRVRQACHERFMAFLKDVVEVMLRNHPDLREQYRAPTRCYGTDWGYGFTTMTCY